MNKLSCAILSFTLLACAPQNQPASQNADIIFVGENIITMDEPAVDAVAIIGERIAATGKAEDILKMRGAETRVVELGERALLPGFIDAHGHISMSARVLDFVNLSSPPVGPVESIDDIVRLLKGHIAEKKLAPGSWVIGYGYDDSLLNDKRHPNRDELDLASSNHPIFLQHVSGHLGAANSAALKVVNINAESENPKGGIIRRREHSDVPNGVLEETALLVFRKILATGFDIEHFNHQLRAAIDLHAGFGITTVQDGASTLADVKIMRAEAERKPYAIDLVAYPALNSLNDEAAMSIEREVDYSGGFRVGGVKFWLDGSPQGRTAYLSQPYTQGPHGADADYRAYPTYKPEEFARRAALLIQRGVPLLAHANGDAAIDDMINGIESALAGKPIPDHRSVVIHAQLMREDQLDKVKSLGIVPSYFSAHTYFWGDWHRKSFGEQRASQISPIRSTIDRGIPFSIHNDTPIVPSDIMRLIDITVNRTTRSGYVLGPEQRATVMEALHAVTLGAAYQYFEEDEKGSITPGKRADLVILGANPLRVETSTIKDIPIKETIARGRTVFRSVY